MPRYKLTIEYIGTDLSGWQKQPNGASVQEHVEKAIYAFSGQETRVQGAGRTDAGVHALGQVAHVDIAGDYPAETVRNALNFYLKTTAIAIVAAEQVGEDFHARFSATGRRYIYRIINRPARLAVEAGRAWHVFFPLDAAAMHDAARQLKGHHDFTSFMHESGQKQNPVKTLDALEVERQGEEIRIHAAARSFLHNQVRIMVGSLSLVGQGKWTKADLKNALEAKDRKAAGPTAPPDGLYLAEVRY